MNRFVIPRLKFPCSYNKSKEKEYIIYHKHQLYFVCDKKMKKFKMRGDICYSENLDCYFLRYKEDRWKISYRNLVERILETRYLDQEEYSIYVGNNFFLTESPLSVNIEHGVAKIDLCKTPSSSDEDPLIFNGIIFSKCYQIEIEISFQDHKPCNKDKAYFVGFFDGEEWCVEMNSGDFHINQDKIVIEKAGRYQISVEIEVCHDAQLGSAGCSLGSCDNQTLLQDSKIYLLANNNVIMNFPLRSLSINTMILSGKFSLTTDRLSGLILKDLPESSCRFDTHELENKGYLVKNIRLTVSS